MKVYQVVLGDGVTLIEIGRDEYFKHARDAVIEGYHLMELANELHHSNIRWDKRGPLVRSKNNVKIAFGYMERAKEPFYILIRIHKVPGGTKTAMPNMPKLLSYQDRELAKELGESIETGKYPGFKGIGLT